MVSVCSVEFHLTLCKPKAKFTKNMEAILIPSINKRFLPQCYRRFIQTVSKAFVLLQESLYMTLLLQQNFKQ